MATNDDNIKWETVEERVIFRNEYIGLRNDKAKRPDGKIVDYGVIGNRDFSGVVCLTTQKKLVLVRQYRYPWQAFSWEIPSGVIESGETPEDAAYREIKEETGFSIKELHFLVKSHPFGMARGWSYLYFAELDANQIEGLSLDPNEFLYTGYFSLEEVCDMIKFGQIIHAPSLLGIYKAIGDKFLQREYYQKAFR